MGAQTLIMRRVVDGTFLVFKEASEITDASEERPVRVPDV